VCPENSPGSAQGLFDGVGGEAIQRHYVAVRLLERDPFLVELQGHLKEAGDGAGRMVLVSGEAGIGKTSLISHFCALNRDTAVLATGACDGGSFSGQRESVVFNGPRTSSSDYVVPSAAPLPPATTASARRGAGLSGGALCRFH
jgi:AAA ATPase domain